MFLQAKENASSPLPPRKRREGSKSQGGLCFLASVIGKYQVGPLSIKVVVSFMVFPFCYYIGCPLSTVSDGWLLSRAQVLKNCVQSLKAKNKLGWETLPGWREKESHGAGEKPPRRGRPLGFNASA